MIPPKLLRKLQIAVSAFGDFLLPNLILVIKSLYLLLPVSVADQVSTVVISSAADTSSKGLLGLIEAQGVNTTGLKSTAAVDVANVVYNFESGVSIQVKLKTDDHPGKSNCIGVN